MCWQECGELESCASLVGVQNGANAMEKHCGGPSKNEK